MGHYFVFYESTYSEWRVKDGKCIDKEISLIFKWHLFGFVRWLWENAHLQIKLHLRNLNFDTSADPWLLCLTATALIKVVFARVITSHIKMVEITHPCPNLSLPLLSEDATGGCSSVCDNILHRSLTWPIEIEGGLAFRRMKIYGLRGDKTILKGYNGVFCQSADNWNLATSRPNFGWNYEIRSPLAFTTASAKLWPDFVITSYVRALDISTRFGLWALNYFWNESLTQCSMCRW